ncbi:hypothetical protein HpSLK36_09430 [Helicobacter pylori]
MAHFIFSVVVVLLWLVAWGIYLVFGKNLKREMEEIENSDPNQNNPFITAAMGIGGAAISIFVAAMIGVCLIWSFNGWSFWKVTGYFLLYVFFCSASIFPNIPN